MPNHGGQEVGRVYVKVLPDLDGFRAKVRATIESIKDAEVDVEANTKGFREEVAAKTKNLPDAKVDVKPELNRTAFMKAIAEVKALASKADSKINIDFKDKEAQAELMASIAKLKAIAKSQKIKLKVDVDEDWFHRTAQGRMKGLLSKIKMPSFGSGINPTGWAVIIGVISALSGPLLGLLSSALLTLPGLITAVAAPVGALMLGLDGLKDAAASLKQPFEELKTTMSDAARDAFTPVFDKLKNLFPTLKASMPRITKGLGDIGQSIADKLTSDTNLGRIDTIFTNIGKSLSMAAPGFGDFIDGMTQLVEQFTKKMPALSEWFNGAGKSFSDWISKIADDGSLSRAFDSLGTTLKTLMDSLGGIFEKGFEFIQDPKNMESFNGFIKGLGTTVEALIQLSKHINSLMSGISKIPGINLLGKGLSWLAGDDMDAKAEEQGKDLANKTFKGFQESAEAQKKSLSDLLLPSKDVTLPDPNSNPFFQILDDTKKSAAQAVTETKKSVQAQVDETKLAISNMVPAQTQAVQKIDPQQAQAAVSELQGMANQANQVAAQASAAFAKIGPAAEKAWTAVREGAKKAGTELVTEVSSWEGKIKEATAGLYSAGFSSGQMIGKGMASGIRAQISEVKTAAKELANAASSSAKTELKVKSPSRVFYDIGQFTAQGFQLGLQDGTSNVIDQGKAMMQGLGTGIEGGYQGVLDHARGLASQLGEAMNSGTAAIGYNQYKARLRNQMQAISLQRQELQQQLEGTGDANEKAAIRDKLKQLSIISRQLSMQRQQLGLTQEYGNEIQSNNQMLGQGLNKMLDAGKGFAEANVNQFMSDIGVSGKGAIPQIGNQMIGWGMNMLSGLMNERFGGGTTIQVNNVDDALAAKQTIDNKRALQIRGR